MDGPKPIDEFTVEPTPAATDYIITKRVGVKAKRSLISSVASTIAAIIGGVYELLANKDTDSTFAANSNTKYPSQKAVVDGIQGGKLIYAPSTTAANTYTANLTPAITAYTVGMVYFVLFTNSNTGAATMNFNGVGAIAMKKNGATALASGDIPAGAMVALLYDGTNFQVIGVASASGIIIGTTPVVGGAAGKLLLESGTNKVTEDSDLSWNGNDVCVEDGGGNGNGFSLLSTGFYGVTLRMYNEAMGALFMGSVNNGSGVKLTTLYANDGTLIIGGIGFTYASKANYPLLRRNGTGLELMNGDVSAYTDFKLAKLISTDKVGVIAPTPATNLSLKGSASTKILSVGGKDKEFYLDSGNLIATGETDLYSRTFEANIFGANGDTAYFSFTTEIVGAGVPTKRLRLYFAGTNVYDSTALAFATGDVVKLSGEIIRVNANVVRITVMAQLNTGVAITKVAYTEVPGLTLTNTNIFKLTGESAGVGSNNNDIVAKMGFIRFEEVSQ